MRQALDDAFAGVAERLPALLAVVLSVAPDATISWAWSCDHEPRRALGFAALHRAATMCLDGLDGEQQLQRLLLTSNASWITSQPLRGAEAGAQMGRAHFVVTTAFCGDIEAGMAVVKTAHLRKRIEAIVAAHTAPACVELRDAIVTMLMKHEAPFARLRSFTRDTGIDVTELGRLDHLGPNRRETLLAWLRSESETP